MGLFSHDSDEAKAHAKVRFSFHPLPLPTHPFSQVEGTEPHEASFTHELIAGAAAYEATKAYQKHKEKEGQPSDHAKAKRILSVPSMSTSSRSTLTPRPLSAGFAGAFVDRVVETKGVSPALTAVAVDYPLITAHPAGLYRQDERYRFFPCLFMTLSFNTLPQPHNPVAKHAGEYYPTCDMHLLIGPRSVQLRNRLPKLSTGPMNTSEMTRTAKKARSMFYVVYLLASRFVRRYLPIRAL